MKFASPDSDDYLKHFICFIFSESSSEIHLSQLLSFWTGADEIPPLGFHKKLEINFVNDKKRLPVAHTCDLSIELAKGEEPDDLKRKLT